MKVLVTGIAGKMGRLVAATLSEEGYDVIGIDRRPWPTPPKNVRPFTADLRKRNATEVFRNEKPDVIVHMATVSNLTKMRKDDRNRINLGGTKAVFDAASTFGAKSVIFIGRHTYYGAVPDVPLYHVETDPPMAVSTFPELADLVSADLYAGGAIWRFPEMKTSILRFCYTLGPTHHGTLANYLSPQKVPTVLGYDPLFQFLHERDFASAIVSAVKHQLRGVFNVAGPDPLPLNTLIKGVERTALPLPELVLKRVRGKLGIQDLSDGAIEHIKYPIVVDASSFKEETGWAHQYSVEDAMNGFLWREMG